MARLWWRSLEEFERDLSGATNERVEEMRDWAEAQQQSADAPGMGRNARARRHFRQMKDAANAELNRRGVLWPEPTGR